MPATRFALLTLGTMLVVGCSTEPSAPYVSGDPVFAKGGSTVTDPTATWLLPLDGEALAIRSDGQFSVGTYSVYADGVCGVGAKIFATTQKSNSGDGIIQTNLAGKGKNACSRSFTLHYSDGFTETVQSFNNLRKLQNTETVIPVGTTVRRQLILNPSVMGESRCGRLLWGEGDFGGGVGSDSVEVTREDARTWHVQSQAPPKNKAWCQVDGTLLDMPPVSFRIVSDRDLP